MIAPSELWSSWSWEPGVVLGLLLAAALYARGARRLWGRPGEHGASARHVASFYGGLGAVAVALVSPLDALSATLFSAHMVQHLSLMIVAAPLLVYASPALPLVLGLPRALRRGLVGLNAPVLKASWRAVTRPLVVLGLNVAALWAWHLPGLYQAALRTEAVHVAEHVTFLATALLFWSLVLSTARRTRLGYAQAVAYVFAISLQSAALGALLTFASTVLYPVHAPGAALWGVGALEDQQLAGAIMWIPGGGVYLLAMAVLLWRLLSGMDKGMQGPVASEVPLEMVGTSER